MIVAVACQKGGSAKTTSAVNLGAALAERGRSTLLIDLDGQGHATYWLLGAEARQNGPFVQDWLEKKASADKVIRPTAVPRLDMAPANLALNHLRDRLDASRRPAEAKRMAERIRGLADGYSWILLDCSAGLNGLTVSALNAADRLLIPVAPPDPLVVDGTHHILVTLDRISKSSNPRLRLLGVLVANAQLRRASQRRQVERMAGDGLPMLETHIPSSARIGSASEAHQSILEHAPASPVAEAYRTLAAEIERKANSAS